MTYGSCHVIVGHVSHPVCPHCQKVILATDIVAMHRPCQYVVCLACFERHCRKQLDGTGSPPICSHCGAFYTIESIPNSITPLNAAQTQIIQQQPNVQDYPDNAPYRRAIRPLGIFRDENDGKQYTVLPSGQVIAMSSFTDSISSKESQENREALAYYQQVQAVFGPWEQPKWGQLSSAQNRARDDDPPFYTYRFVAPQELQEQSLYARRNYGRGKYGDNTSSGGYQGNNNSGGYRGYNNSGRYQGDNNNGGYQSNNNNGGYQGNNNLNVNNRNENNRQNKNTNQKNKKGGKRN